MNVHLTFQIPRSEDLDQSVLRLQQKLDHLLRAFQPELVQLQGRLVRHSGREGVVCRLNLHLPTAQLSSEETEATAKVALRAAGEDLIRQVQKHKARLREGRSQPQARLPQEPGAGVVARNGKPVRAPGMRLVEAKAANAQRRNDLAGYFGVHYGEVLGFVQRQIRLRERLGELPVGSLEPTEVLNEAVMAALDDQPEIVPMSRGRWLLLLAAGAMRRLVKANSNIQHGQELLTLNSDPMAGDEPDPEELASTTEMMQQLATALQSLPAVQRHDLVLYLLEGFRPSELARISHRRTQEVEVSLREAENALQGRSDLPARLRQHLQAGVERLRA